MANRCLLDSGPRQSIRINAMRFPATHIRMPEIDYSARPGPSRLSLLLLLFAALLVGLSPRLSASSDPFFQAEVKVASQEVAERNRALRAAFAQVLVRLTADPAIVNQPWTRSARTKADHYLQQFRYQSRVAGRDHDESEETYLICDFNGPAITRLLEQNGIAYWSSARPAAIAWVLLETDDGARIIDDTHPDLAPALIQAARRTGLDLVLPLMDLQEQRLVQPYHIQYSDTQPLAEASARYDTSIYIVTHIRALAEDLFTATWQLSFDDQPIYWRTREPAPLSTLLNETLAAISAELFKTYSYQSRPEKLRSQLQITHINDSNQYEHAWNYLDRLQGVTKVIPASFAGRQAEFVVEHSGTATELQRVIELGDTLEREKNGPPPATAAVGADQSLHSISEPVISAALRYRLSQ